MLPDPMNNLHASTPETASTDGGNVLDDEAYSTLIAGVLDKVAQGPMSSIHKSLNPEMEEIVSRIHARIAGCDDDGDFLAKKKEVKDLAAIAIMNNSLVLRRADLAAALGCSDPLPGRKTFEDYAKSGWHVKDVSARFLRGLLSDGGYAFLLEYHADDGQRVPVGYQFGFPFVPPAVRYPSLSAKTLPPLSTFTTHHQDSWTIWRTGIIENINAVREAYLRSGFPVHPALEGKELHRLGAGQATKVVAVQAAIDLQKSYIQFNIGRIVRPDHENDILAKNVASLGSNREIFDQTEFTRSCVEQICWQGYPLVEIYWQLFRSKPTDAFARLLRPDGALTVKGWNILDLQRVGSQLAGRINDE